MESVYTGLLARGQSGKLIISYLHISACVLYS